MATTPTAPANLTLPWGAITLDGQTYMEQPQIYCFDQQIDFPLQVLENVRFSLPGAADFLLKGLARDETLVSGGGSINQGFRFRLHHAAGSSWYFGGGIDIFDDRVVDFLCFGTAQFPYPLIPPVPFHANGDMIFEIEDLGNNFATNFPYVIHFAFHGSLLIPLD